MLSTSEAAPDELCDVEDSVPVSSTREAAPDELCDVEDSDPVSSTSEAAPDELCDVEDSVPVSFTSEAAPDELCDVEDSVPISTGKAAPTSSVPYSELIVSTVRHVTGIGSGLLGEIPRVVGCSDICSYLMGHCRCTRTYVTKRNSGMKRVKCG